MGDYEISYRVVMEEFPDLGYTGTFTARIRFCFLERLIPTPITPRLYQVGVEEALEITWTDFAQEPSICNHEVKYDFFLINEDGEVRDLERGGNLPDWLTFWDSGRRFEVLTDDVDDVGEYFIEIVSVLRSDYFAEPPVSPASTMVQIEILGSGLVVGETLSLDLEDQTIDMYGELFYPIRRYIPRCPDDTYPSLSVSKQGTDDFLEWESRTRTFIV